MNTQYKVLKYKSDQTKIVKDFVSIEEPLQISLKYKDKKEWKTDIISITMRTPGHDEDLVRGFLFNEQIITNIKQIDSIKSFGDKVGKYNIQNKILAKLNNSNNVQITKIKRVFLTNSSCGVCGKSSLDTLDMIKPEKTYLNKPKLKKEVIIQAPDLLRVSQSEFSKTGGIHASGLFSSNGKLLALREDVGRHNALDKLIGNILKKKLLNPSTQFITCSGRLNFELVQKVLMTNIGILVGVGAPTSLAIDLAKKYNITLIGFVKKYSFNIYANKQKVIL